MSCPVRTPAPGLPRVVLQPCFALRGIWLSPIRLKISNSKHASRHLIMTLTSILQATPCRRPAARQDLPLHRAGPRVADPDVADREPCVHSDQGPAPGDQHGPDAAPPAVHARSAAGDHGLLQLGVDGRPSQRGAGVGPGTAGEDQQLGRGLHGAGPAVESGRRALIPRCELSRGEGAEHGYFGKARTSTDGS